MADRRDAAGRALWLLASGGWAEWDADVVAELLEQARALATLAAADLGASPAVRTAASRFLGDLHEDTSAGP